MGLTIHYSLRAAGTDAVVRKYVETLHENACNLPFKKVEIGRAHV